MSVLIQDGEDDYSKQILNRIVKTRRCGLCNGILAYPFLYWDGFTDAFKEDDDLVVCGDCCKRLSSPGFQADLVHLKAILDMRKLRGDKVLLKAFRVAPPKKKAKTASL
jgi:hypothetical protein